MLHSTELNLFRELFYKSIEPDVYLGATGKGLLADLFEVFRHWQWTRANKSKDPAEIIKFLRLRNMQSTQVLEDGREYIELEPADQNELHRFIALSRLSWGDNFRAVYDAEKLSSMGALAYWAEYNSEIGLSREATFTCRIDGACWHEYGHLLTSRALKAGIGLLIHGSFNVKKTTDSTIKREYNSLDELFTYAGDLERVLIILKNNPQLTRSQIRMLRLEIKSIINQLNYYNNIFIAAVEASVRNLESLENLLQEFRAYIESNSLFLTGSLSQFVNSSHPVISKLDSKVSNILAQIKNYFNLTPPLSRTTIWSVTINTDYENGELTIPLYGSEVEAAIEASRHLTLSNTNLARHTKALDQFAENKYQAVNFAKTQLLRRMSILNELSDTLSQINEQSKVNDEDLNAIVPLVSRLLKP